MADYPEDLQQSLAAAIVAAYEDELRQLPPDEAVVTNPGLGTTRIDLTQAQ